jgi:hypothetical protein
MHAGAVGASASTSQVVPEPAGIIEAPSQGAASGAAAGITQGPSDNDLSANKGTGGGNGPAAMAEPAAEPPPTQKDAAPDQAPPPPVTGQTLDKAKVLLGSIVCETLYVMCPAGQRTPKLEHGQGLMSNFHWHAGLALITRSACSNEQSCLPGMVFEMQGLRERHRVTVEMHMSFVGALKSSARGVFCSSRWTS